MRNFTSMNNKEMEREQAFITEAMKSLIERDICFYVFLMCEPTMAKLVQTSDGTYYISCDLDWADYVADYIHYNHKAWTVEDSEDKEGNIVYVVTNKKNYDIN